MFGGGTFQRKIDELEDRVESLQGELEEFQLAHRQELQVLRVQLAQTASGQPPAPQAILSGSPFTDIPAVESPDLIANTPGILVLDVRTQAEWNGGHIADAVHIDVQQFESRMGELPKEKETPIVCFCAGGARSAAACHMMSERGYTRLFNVAGGMNLYLGETVQ